MVNKKHYDSLTESERAKIVRNKYDNKDAIDPYSTSNDIYLRELEIEFIIDNIKRYGKPNPTILDIGCGNGYTDFRIINALDCVIDGIDFSKNMINGAKLNRDKQKLKNKTTFTVINILDNGWDIPVKNHYDIIITERLLLNLPSKNNQFNIIDKIFKMLKPDGLYLMIEGTKEGLYRLNNIREEVGLKGIIDRDDDNVSSLKFDEIELDAFLYLKFKILLEKYWSLYYLISRVVYPLHIYPKQPKFNSKMNLLAKTIENTTLKYNSEIGHVRGLVLQKF